MLNVECFKKIAIRNEFRASVTLQAKIQGVGKLYMPTMNVTGQCNDIINLVT